MSGKNCTECHGTGWLDSEGEPVEVVRGALTSNGVHHCDNCGGTGWEAPRTTLSDGTQVYPAHRELKANGQQQGYVVLAEEERAKGFVRPVRDMYTHLKCGGVTTMGRALAETYARDPSFYSGTFCATCRAHYPLDQFHWHGTNEQVGS